MSEESPEERVARLERELAAAKVDKLEHELADAKHAAGMPASGSPHRAGDAAAARAQLREMLADTAAPMRDMLDQLDRTRERAPIDTTLAATPRRVPTAFLLAELLPFSWWAAFTLMMVGVSPIALWIFRPKLMPIAGVATLLLLLALHIRKAAVRLSLLAWGKVATLEHAEEASRGTYYSGTTYNNMRIPIAHGWKVTREFYSGPKIVTRVRYHLDGKGGVLVLGGRGYSDGVILADSRDPRRALCVTAFPYDLDRDGNGNWLGTLRTGVVAGMVASVILYGGWIAATVWAFHRFW
jgi:hypothetical protein